MAMDTAVGDGDHRQQCRNLLLGFTNKQIPIRLSSLSSISGRVSVPFDLLLQSQGELGTIAP